MLGKLKYYLKRNINIKSGYTLAIGIISIFLVVGGFSFAIFTATTEQKGVLNIVTGNLYSLLESDLLNTSNSISIPASSSKTFYIRIKNVNTVDAKFNLYYTKVEGVNVAYSSAKESAPTTSGIVISAGAKREIEIVIDNTTTSSKTINFGSDVGLSNKPLTFPVGKEVITKLPSAVETLLKKANPVEVVDYNVGNKAEMFTFKHPAGVQQVGYTEEELTDYRYIGNTPNNYVTFNNELWRIIGVFTVENESGIKEKRIKIVREQNIGFIKFGSTNDWTTSTLAELLNKGDYYNRRETYVATGLTQETKEMIANAKWWLGASSVINYSGPNIYEYERGTTVPSGHSISWIGEVGVMYASDYVYTFANGVDNTCYTEAHKCRPIDTDGRPGWHGINQLVRLLNPIMGYDTSGGTIIPLGASTNIQLSNIMLPSYIKPVVYLKSNIQIDSGDGSSTNPYTLK